MSGGGGSDTTTSTKVELPWWASSPASQNLNNLSGWSQQKYQQYPGQRVAPLDPNQTLGLQMTAQRAQNDPTLQAAQGQLQDTANGKYLDLGTNPQWQSMSDQINRAYMTGIAPQTDAAFERAGAYGIGNSAYDQTVGRNQQDYGTALTNLAGQLYGQERGRQVQASALAPGASAADYTNLQALVGAGDAQRSYNQDVLNQNYQNWWEQRQYPYTQASMFASVLPGLLGNSGTTTQTAPNPYQASRLANTVGLGAAGAAGGAALAGTGAMEGAAITPYAPYLGAIAGALAGYYGARI